MPKGSSSDTTVVLGVRESNLYRLKGSAYASDGKQQQSDRGQGASSSEGCADSTGVRIQRKLTFRIQWEGGAFQVCQEIRLQRESTGSEGESVV
jgi:hypothetical protein